MYNQPLFIIPPHPIDIIGGIFIVYGIYFLGMMVRAIFKEYGEDGAGDRYLLKNWVIFTFQWKYR